MSAVLSFLIEYSRLLYAVSATLVLCYGFINCLLNPYRADNKRIAKFTKSFDSEGFCEKMLLRLPLCYRMQFQVFLRCKASAHSFFVFCRRSHRRILLSLSALTVTLSLALSAHELFNGVGAYGYGAALALFYVLALLATENTARIQTEKAKKLFGRFVDQVDERFGIEIGENLAMPVGERFLAKGKGGDFAMPVGERFFAKQNANRNSRNADSLSRENESIRAVQKLIGQGVDKARAEKLVALLTPDRLERPRTVEEQRHLNRALNDLIHAVSKRPVGAQK